MLLTVLPTPLRRGLACAALGLLSACSGPPPKPPQVQGEYRPINRTPAAPAADARPRSAPGFDFRFTGDIQAALDALHERQPQLTVLPPLGPVVPLPVQLNLHDASLEDALRAIGAQGGSLAEVVYSSTGHVGSDQAYIRFQAQPQATPEPLRLESQAPTN